MVDTLDAEPTSHGLTCWLLDTRSLWPGVKITDSASVRSLRPRLLEVSTNMNRPEKPSR